MLDINPTQYIKIIRFVIYFQARAREDQLHRHYANYNSVGLNGMHGMSGMTRDD